MQYNPADYTARQLKAIAKEKRIPRYGSMTKAQLSRSLNAIAIDSKSQAAVDSESQADNDLDSKNRSDDIDSKSQADMYSIFDINVLMHIALNLPDRY
jgi:hypothetical protein